MQAQRRSECGCAPAPAPPARRWAGEALFARGRATPGVAAARRPRSADAFTGVCALLVLPTTLCVAAAASGAEISAPSDVVLAAASPEAAELPLRVQQTAEFVRAGTLAQYRISTLRFAINVAVALLFLGVAAARVRRRAPWRELALPGGARIALVLLAAAQIIVNLNFVVRASPHGFHGSDTFHYVFGSKYFPEVGYFDLYRCSAAAASEAGPGAVVIRNLRDDRLEKIPLRRLPRDRCGGLFDAKRWEMFQRDVRWFRSHVGDAMWRDTLRDHGFNPSPLWTAIGRPIASLVPIDEFGLRVAARLDWLLIAAVLAAAWRAFGLEAACLVALVWAGSGLNRYAWIGDSFLRHLWFGAALCGLCALRQRAFALAGALLGAAGGFRLFPAVYLAGALAVQGVRTLRERRLHAGLVRTAAGAGAALLLLGVAGVLVAGRGPAVAGEFTQNIRGFASTTAANSIGLAPLVSYRRSRPSAVMHEGERILATDQRYPSALSAETRAGRAWIEWSVMILFAGLFARAALRPRARDWEVAAAAFALIPVFSQPPCYYVGLFAPAALLCVERPWLRWAVLAALLCWSGAQLAFFGAREEYLVGSLVGLGLGLAVLAALQRDPPSAFDVGGASERGAA